MPSVLSYLRCFYLIPYFLACVCLFFLGLVERLARLCLPEWTSSDNSELVCCRMRTKLALQLKVTPICQSMQRSTSLFFESAATVGANHKSAALIGILCPSVIMRECDEFLKYVEEGDKEVKEMKEEIALCSDKLVSLRCQRLECLKQYETRSEDFFVKLDQWQRLQNHLETLKENVEARRISSQTQAVAERTGYHGIVDWAKRTSDTHDSLLRATAQVAFVGAGLTYGSIFGANRGNVGLMCYAFALFDCGFIIPTVALVLLKWASIRPKDTLFCSPHTWTLLLNVFTYASVAAVGSAILLMNMTLFLLVFPLNSSDQRTEPGPQFTVSPRPAGGISLGCLLLSVGMILVCTFLHYFARGWDGFVHDFVGHQPSLREKEVV